MTRDEEDENSHSDSSMAVVCISFFLQGGFCILSRVRDEEDWVIFSILPWPHLMTVKKWRATKRTEVITHSNSYMTTSSWIEPEPKPQTKLQTSAFLFVCFCLAVGCVSRRGLWGTGAIDLPEVRALRSRVRSWVDLRLSWLLTTPPILRGPHFWTRETLTQTP